MVGSFCPALPCHALHCAPFNYRAASPSNHFHSYPDIHSSISIYLSIHCGKKFPFPISYQLVSSSYPRLLIRLTRDDAIVDDAPPVKRRKTAPASKEEVGEEDEAEGEGEGEGEGEEEEEEEGDEEEAGDEDAAASKVKAAKASAGNGVEAEGEEEEVEAGDEEDEE